MGALQNVREIVSKLTQEEKETIRTYLGFFSEKGKLNKSLRLFDALASSSTNEELSEEELQELVYGKPNLATFVRLVTRLKDKILEGLLLDINISREGAYPERSRVTIEIRKSITQAQILQNRGARKIAGSMFEKTIELAKKYELYDELLLALRFLIKQTTADTGKRNLNKLLRLYDKYDYAKNAVLRAEINHRKVNAETDFHTGQNLDTNWLRDVLDEMSKDHKKTESDQIGYYYYFLEAQYHQSLRNFLYARRSLQSNQRLIENSVSIHSPIRLGAVALNLADNDLYLTDFSRSYNTAESALSFFKKGSFNYEQGVELMFYSKFYKREYQIAANIIFQLVPEVIASSNFRSGKRSFLLASTYFMLEDYATAIRYLQTLNPIEVDKEGWSWGVKLLNIQTLIELNQMDEVEAKIETLRKFIENNQISDHRIKLIFQILNSFVLSDFSFQNTYQKEKGALEMLDATSGALAWTIKSPEMVIFNQWFHDKVFKKRFVQRINSFQLDDKPKKMVGQEGQ